ncbi:unnamed protein product [Brachionus calyciflorus]|nr:unnamed protein product [Brachionus calyciflorus]
MFSFLSSSEITVVHMMSHDTNNNNNNNFNFKIGSDLFYLGQLIAALASAILYIFHVPERFWPGRFDIIGQSHQIFHLTSFVCSWCQFMALKYDMRQLVEMINEHSIIDKMSFGYSIVPLFNFKISNFMIMGLCLVVNFFILIYYYFKAVNFNPWINLNKQQDKNKISNKSKKRLINKFIKKE